MKYADVILPLPLEGLFTYQVPNEMMQVLKPGMRVLVPFGKTKTYTAVCYALHDCKPDFEVKEIAAILDDSPMVLSRQLKFWNWISEYYLSPMGDVYKAALPAGLKAEEGYRPKTEKYIVLAPEFRSQEGIEKALDMAGARRAKKQCDVLQTYLSLSQWRFEGASAELQKVSYKEVTREELMNESHCTSAVIRALVSEKQILKIYEKEVGRLGRGGDGGLQELKTLNEPQERAFNEINEQFVEKNVVLLHGVTSSGKTEIYLHLIERCIKEGKQVLYLLPEIALTVQIMARLRKVLGDALGIYHSRYSDDERVEIWKKQMSDNPYQVILGARSAVFLPFQNLGLVIVDEEHETSFKQQDPAPRYHGRSAAIVLAQLYGAKTLLGTATPSMESYYNAQKGKYGLVKLSTRYKGIELPEIKVVDVADLRHRKMMKGPFSPDLLRAIRETLAEGKQVILFQNRRGFAPMIECKVCGWVPRCKHCDVSLTLHRNENFLTCHYCGYTCAVPQRCPNCENEELRTKGYGTEKIEEAIYEIFPEARIARMDLDTTRTKNAYERLLGNFASQKTNVLIGTQMISKGLDFDNVSVVGILNADGMLSFPDFRAYEHAFMMMSQVSGRAGRKGRRGVVFLQTKMPDSPVIRQIVNHDYSEFFNDQCAERAMFHYPPFYRLIYVYMKHKNERVVESAALFMGGWLRQVFGERVLGPDKPSVARVKTLFIRKIMLKIELGADLKVVRNYLRQAQAALFKDKRYATLQLYFDVDPE